MNTKSNHKPCMLQTIDTPKFIQQMKQYLSLQTEDTRKMIIFTDCHNAILNKEQSLMCITR